MSDDALNSAGVGPLRLSVNGQLSRVAVDPCKRLVDVLREDLRLTGTHIGCDTSQCGACVVHLDGASVKACTVLAGQAEGREITTIEGLAPPGELSTLQRAFRDHHALQCGFCTPGMVMSATDLLSRNPNPSEPEIRDWLKGAFCRCTGYQNIVRAIRAAAAGAPAPAPKGESVGDSVPRSEDKRFLTGGGRYTDDITAPGQAYAAFVRSPHAHAEILDIDTGLAEAAPGIIGVLTGEDVAADGVGALTSSWRVVSTDGSSMRGGERPILAHGKVRHIGDPVAVVIAESRAAAETATDLVAVTFDVLPPVIDPAAATAGPALHADAPRNTCFNWEFGDADGVDQAFAAAADIVTLDLTNNRVVPNALEPRAAIGDYDSARDAFTLHVTSQNPHMARHVICEATGLAPEHKLRVVSPDVGGGFGSKIFIYAEECVCLWASKRLGVPVKWTARRSESFLTDPHGREHVTRASLALDADGRFLGLRVATIANLGAYLSSFAAFVPSYLYATMLAGPYRTPAIHCAVDAVFTNTAPVDAYRGAGRPEAAYLLETLVDEAARQTGRDPIALRRLNFVRPEHFPYQTPVAVEYDSGDFERHLSLALERADYNGFPERRAEAAARGKMRGIGVSCYIEACGIAPSAVAGALGAEVGLWESCKLRFTTTGKLQIFTGSHSHGQGHETTFAQIAAERLGVPFDDIEVIHGDTATTPIGMGTYGSRSLVVGGSALVKAADKVIAKGQRIAAHLLDAEIDEIAFGDGRFFRRGRNDHVSIQDVVRAAYVPHDYPEDLEPGMEETAFYDPENFTFPSGTHVCEVEIDPETGVTKIAAFTAVDDFGRVVNPMIVEGQVHGGLAQGIGQALYEGAVYDPESGGLLTRSFKTYRFPRADDIPNFDTATTETLCDHNPLGAKGAGEAGAIGAPPAVMNALRDALGVRVSMPATPEKVWRALREAKRG